ncbi:unnamed protein product, partial [Timema podura]|nr:unnamed protein product [Timema podura]
MPTVLCLARMELTGLRFSREEAEKLRRVLEIQMLALEEQAYKLVGHTFSLTSPADVAKVLYRELGLSSGKLNTNQKPSTNKEALTKIKSEHPLPGLILQWRKINSIITK